jgi:ferric iron reductase protein FhuF
VTLLLGLERTPSGADGLLETLARIGRLGDGYELQTSPDGEGWLPAETLINGGPEFDRVIDRLMAGSTDPKARRAIGSRFVLSYLRFLWPVAAAFALERRVPDVSADNLLIRLDGAGWPAAFALKRPRFATLEQSTVGEASHVADEAALLGWLHQRSIDANAGPLIETVRTQLLTSGTALWGNVAAAFVHPLLWHVQHVAPEASAIVRDAEALLSRREAPRLDDQVRLLTVIQDDAEWTVHARKTCCLRWCLPDESRCTDCPLVREPEAGAFLRDRLAEAITAGEALRTQLGLQERVAVSRDRTA